MEPTEISFYTVTVDFDTLTSLFRRLGTGQYNWWEVCAELVLIGLSVNWCASVLHGTRGTRLLRGLLVVLVAATLIVHVLAEQLGWTRLELLYRYFVIGLAFIALIAFQPELRRALIRAGDVRFLRRGTPRGKLIPALIEAAGYLSRNRYGALIAIQRDVGLANWSEAGTELNAEITANLLKTIFFPNSALHDLGAIIRGNRVLAAGCQFPVAESGETDPNLGSRHRAAVGLTMESDALVLVVSEETGTISLADKGKLTRYLALDDLEEELESRLSGRYLSTARRRRAGTLSDTWRFLRRVLTVVPLTFVIWFLADQANQITAAGIPVRLSIGHDNAWHVDVDTPQSGVFELDLRGPTRGVEALRAVASDGPIKLNWTLPPLYGRPGPLDLDEEKLQAILSELPVLQGRGVYVENVEPANLSLVVDAVETRRVPVRPNAGALRVALESIEPAEVEVRLRRRDLERLGDDQLYVEAALDDLLSGAARNRPLSFEGVPIERRLGDITVLSVEPRVVDVRLRVVAERDRARISGVRVRVAASPQVWERYDIDVADANEWLLELEVEGDKDVIRNLTALEIQAVVPLTVDQVVPGGDYRSMEVVIDLPDGVTLVGPSRQVQFRLIAREGSTP